MAETYWSIKLLADSGSQPFPDSPQVSDSFGMMTHHTTLRFQSKSPISLTQLSAGDPPGGL